MPIDGRPDGCNSREPLLLADVWPTGRRETDIGAGMPGRIIGNPHAGWPCTAAQALYKAAFFRDPFRTAQSLVARPAEG